MMLEIPRAATMPSLADGGLAQYQRDGYLRMPGLLDPELLDKARPHAIRLAVHYHAANTPPGERADWAAPRLCVTNSWLRSDSLRSIVLRRDLAALAGTLLQCDAVQLYADMIILKEPSCAEGAWHCDSAYVPVDPDALAILWFPFSAMTAEQGGLALRPGSHLWEPGTNFRPDRPLSVRRTHRGLDAAGFVVDDAPFAQGDAAFYTGRTFHRGSANRTNEPSCAMFIMYLRGNEPLRRPINDTQEREWRMRMSGVAVGKPIHTPLHPLLWRR